MVMFHFLVIKPSGQMIIDLDYMAEISISDDLWGSISFMQNWDFTDIVQLW